MLNVYGSEVFNNGWFSDEGDGIDVNGSGGEIIGNLSYNNLTSVLTLPPDLPPANAGNGIEIGPTSDSGGNVVRNNTLWFNVASGVSVRAGGSENLIERNVIYDNIVGISVIDEDSPNTDQNQISQNSIYQNVSLGIDLAVDDYDSVTLNDQDDLDQGGNELTNFPIVTSAVLSGRNLTVTGFAEPGALIELFITDPDETGFGEGIEFVTSFVEGSLVVPVDTDATTGPYGPFLTGCWSPAETDGIGDPAADHDQSI